MTGEKVLYSDRMGNRITNSRATFGLRNYALAEISSAELHRIPPNRKAPIIMVIVGIPTIFVLVGFFLLFAGISRLIKDKGSFALRITTPSGTTTAFSSKDRVYIEKLVQATRDAIVARG
ncbi:MAG: hypothetical protein HY532_05580 [Chloroflexi bacterium]|nr:hypothetical protein [Chloroflexota bacterium]